MIGTEIEQLIKILARLPGLGPRSARRAALALLKKREALLRPLAASLEAADAAIATCDICFNLDTSNPCQICAQQRRDSHILCVVEDVADLWAMERAGIFHGQYHVLGGVLSALDGITPDDLHIASLIQRVGSGDFSELILALNATVDGQATAHYLHDRLAPYETLQITRLAHGVPLGSELDYLDDGTLALALNARQAV